ncbi:MAG: hypothetical protein RL758_209 [Pseudomonadota bacterium]|jgi:hypothetical protein
MSRLLEFLWHGCWHNWKHTGSGSLTQDEHEIGRFYTYKCSKCERHKDINVY